MGERLQSLERRPTPCWPPTLPARLLSGWSSREMRLMRLPRPFQRSARLLIASLSRACSLTSWNRTASTAKRRSFNPSEAQRKEHEKYEFALHEVYAVDVLISSGEGQGREKDAKITIYKKIEDTYMLKMKTSREFFSKVSKQFGTMPFNLRSMDDEKKARMGVHECVSHKLIDPFQVLFDKEGAYVAQYKFTVLLMPNGPHKITGLPFDESLYKSEHSIEDAEIQKLLKTSANPKAAKKKKKAAEKAVSDETAGDDAAPTLVEQ